MWIRTQDKEVLVYANNFYIIKTRGEEKYEISYFDGDSFVQLGFYKSKERAIEVLDEIQKLFILNVLKHKGYDYKNLIYDDKDTLVEHLQNELDDKNMEIEHLKEEIKNIIQDRDDNFRRLGDEELLWTKKNLLKENLK